MPVMTAVAPKAEATRKSASRDEFPDEILEIQRIKNEVAMHLLEDWLADDSGYDEMVWETVKTTIEENRLSERRCFDA
jgi:hypothetical protein